MKHGMKALAWLLPFFLFTLNVCKAQQVDSVHQKKAMQIIERMIGEKPLLTFLPKGDSVSMSELPPHVHDIFYFVVREVNGNPADTVEMQAEIDDSLLTIDFHEGGFHLRNGKTGYNYNIDKGEITFAYLHIPKELKDGSGYIDYDTNLKRFHPELKNDSTPTIDKEYTLAIKNKADLKRQRELDRKAFAFYEPKLLKSIDELYDLLFK